VLKDELSASLRDALLAQIPPLTDEEEATTWASSVLSRKNSLTAADAKLVEIAFEQKLLNLSIPAGKQTAFRLSDVAPEKAAPKQTQAQLKKLEAKQKEGEAQDREVRSTRARRIDKSVLTFPAAKRKRNKEHLHHIVQQPCLVCGRKPSDPHHLRFTQPRALGRKVSDEFTVPLCRMHHREAHRAGDERIWWKRAGLDPVKVAHELWKQTHMSEPHITAKRESDTPDAAHSGLPAGRIP
jgi:hypothetical protein